MKEFLKKVFGKADISVEPEIEKLNDERMIRELLRENLSTISVDMFGLDDPMIMLPAEQRKLYLKKFYDLSKDEVIVGRMKYLMNKQAAMTLKNSRDGVQDVAGAMTINGIAYVMNDAENLGAMYIKENVPAEPLSREEQFKVV